MILTVEQIKALVPSINININDKMIEEACTLVEHTILADSIGQEFYEEIRDQVSGNTLTTDNKYLFDNYLQYIVAYSIWQYLTITLSYNLNEAGVRIKTSDHSTLAESTDINYYRTYIQNFIDNKRDQMNKYIRLINNNYPKYYSNKYGDSPSEHIYNFKIGKVGGNYDKQTYMGLDEGPVK